MTVAASSLVQYDVLWTRAKDLAAISGWRGRSVVGGRRSRATISFGSQTHGFLGPRGQERRQTTSARRRSTVGRGMIPGVVHHPSFYPSPRRQRCSLPCRAVTFAPPRPGANAAAAVISAETFSLPFHRVLVSRFSSCDRGHARACLSPFTRHFPLRDAFRFRWS